MAQLALGSVELVHDLAKSKRARESIWRIDGSGHRKAKPRK